MIITPVVLYLGYIKPVHSGLPGVVFTPEASIVTLRDRNTQYKDTLSKIISVEENINRTEKQYKEIDGDLRKKIETMLPPSIDPIKLRNEIITIGNKNGVAVTNVGVVLNQRNQNKDLGSYLVTFNLISRYPAFKSFIEAYEKNLRFYVHDSVTIKRQEEKSGDVDKIEDPEALSISVTSKVYYFK